MHLRIRLPGNVPSSWWILSQQIITASFAKVTRWSTFDPSSTVEKAKLSIVDNYYDANDFINGTNGCRLVIINNVNTLEEGLYDVIYYAIDGSGNTSERYQRLIQVVGSTTTVNNEAFSSSINVYPNPSAGIFAIEFSEAVSKNVKVEVVNVLGEVVSVMSYKDLSSGMQMNANLGSLSAGVYMLHITDNGNTAVKKITISK
jgi:hypothetical protein